MTIIKKRDDWRIFNAILDILVPCENVREFGWLHLFHETCQMNKRLMNFKHKNSNFGEDPKIDFDKVEEILQNIKS